MTAARMGRRPASRDLPPAPCGKCGGEREWTACRTHSSGAQAKCTPCTRESEGRRRSARVWNGEPRRSSYGKPVCDAETADQKRKRIDRVAATLPCPVHQTRPGRPCPTTLGKLIVSKASLRVPYVCLNRHQAALEFARTFEVHT